jgi:hypothetical protein
VPLDSRRIIIRGDAPAGPGGPKRVRAVYGKEVQVRVREHKPPLDIKASEVCPLSSSAQVWLIHREMIDSFTYCGLSKVDIKNPEVEFVIFEDCTLAFCDTEHH